MDSPTIRLNRPATPAEAAAIAAAIERFTSDTAVAPPSADTGISPWLKAALVEGVSAKDPFGPGDPNDLF
jgi:phenylpyruvate tautomerase PptA (4-oxalocrotonate tautomerase family)